ncbi:MAG: hypothetical protein AAF337_08495 [Pseudomonadota bacterium]
MPNLKTAVKNVVRPAVQPLLEWRAYQKLPALAKDAIKRDHDTPLPAQDPGAQAIIDAALEWLCHAQDKSTSKDGGVARHWGYLDGWAASYPETTGYIVPTFLRQAEVKGDAQLRARAKKMLDWLVSIQFENGGFQGGVIGQEPVVPVTFNTGQILLGLAAGARIWPDAYLEPMRKAADFIATSLDADGCWRRYPTPFASHDDKSYETHVSWGLFEAARVEANDDWVAAANRQIDWAMTHQRSNGWMDQCCLSDKTMPISHTLGYALRGFVEAWRYTQEERHLSAALNLAEGLRSQLHENGFLPGAFYSDWSAAADWACVTGVVQIAHSWLLLFEATQDEKWLDAGTRANAWARRTVVLEHKDVALAPTLGAVKGSHPCDGDYCRLEFPNWAAKFMIDSCQQDIDLRAT